MIQEMIKAFALIFVAEMGDKTQILAMAFATKYPVKKVLLGIFIGAFLNHGIAVALGAYISDFFPLGVIQIVAGFAFIAFAFWTLISDDSEEGEEKQRFKIGPVLTVALAFFIGELGDKTQLAAITLASESTYPFIVLCGTVSGMIVTGGMGIWVGKKIGDRVPELTIKLIAAGIFMLFGIIKLFNSIPGVYLTPAYITLFFLSLAISTFFILKVLMKRTAENKNTTFKRNAEVLYDYYHQINKNLEDICLGEKNCKKCLGNACIIGCCKSLAKRGLNKKPKKPDFENSHTFTDIKKNFDRDKLIHNLRMTVSTIKSKDPDQKNDNLNRIRKNLEFALTGNYVEKINDWNRYEVFMDGLEK